MIQQTEPSERSIQNRGETKKRRKKKQSQRKSRLFASQAYLYVVFFFLCHVFGAVSAALNTWRDRAYSPLVVLASVLVPLKGFFNCAIYCRPRYLRYRKNHPEEQALFQLIRAYVREKFPKRQSAASGSAAVGDSTPSSSDQRSGSPTLASAPRPANERALAPGRSVTFDEMALRDGEEDDYLE